MRRKRVQKKRGVVWIDDQNQIDKDLMRGNLDNYRDTMRCDTPRQDRRSSQTGDAAEMLLNGPGRKLGKGLGKLWSSAKKMIHLHERTGTWDFDQSIQDDSGAKQMQQPAAIHEEYKRKEGEKRDEGMSCQESVRTK